MIVQRGVCDGVLAECGLSEAQQVFHSKFAIGKSGD